MRIISGDARGRSLTAPGGEDTRPTGDKARGALFNILGTRVRGAAVLDLFGGTGALALESLSRGAAQAVIVDHAEAAIRAIRRNAEAVVGAGSARVAVIRADYRAALERLPAQTRFDLVFLDPPYRMREAYADALARLRERNLLAEDCVIVCERAQELPPVQAEGFEIYDTRRYGAAGIDFLKEIRP